ncbi:MAG: S8 family serine peptidase [Planctomycetes bacterium]|nr:S8 family serine peptidase [Planctomycetota bacterium]
MLVFFFIVGDCAQSDPENPRKSHLIKFNQAQVLFNQQSVPDGQHRVKRKRILREERLKYPLVRADETLLTIQSTSGEEVILNQEAMVADHIIVKLHEDVSEEALATISQKYNTSILRKLHTPRLYLIAFEQYLEPEAIEETVSNYESETAYISSAGPDYIWSVALFPNDPNFAPQWALHNTGQLGGTPDADIDAPEAWDITTGNPSIAVAIIDSGIDYTHPDLAANMWTNPGETPGNHRDDDHNGYNDDVYGWNFVNDNNDPMDEHGHGTHCAGIVGSVGNNAIGGAGVNWQVSLVALRFLDANGSGYDSDAIEAINYATNNGIKITSNSWGGFPYSTQLEIAISVANQAGVLFIAAAGNDASDNDITPFYPASFDLDNIIAVANTTDDDELNWSSNYGLTSVDLAATGTGIRSTAPGGEYIYGSGTSAAAPHVAGAAALLWGYETGLTHLQVKTRILERADHRPGLLGFVPEARRLNAFNMLNPAWTPPAPHVIVDSVTLTDVGGDGNGYLEIGETVEILPLLVNENFPDAENVNVDISCSSPNVMIMLPDTVSAGTLGAFASVEPSPPFRFYLDSGLSRNELVEYTLTVTYAPSYSESFTFSFVVSPGDVYEPDNMPPAYDTITVGEIQDRTIHAIGDPDWVAFTLPRSTEVKIETDGPGSDDTVLSLYGPDSSTTLLATDDNSGTGNFSLIARNSSAALPSGTYYIKINENGDNQTIADYTLSLSRFNNPVAVPEVTPAANFTPLTAAFSSASSYDPDGDAITGWEWMLGTETISTSATFLHDFFNPGIYQLTHRVKNTYGVWSAPEYLELTAWIPGDVDKDWKVDFEDFTLLRIAYSSTPSSPNWNPECDFDNSGKVDWDDFIVLKTYYGHSLPE